MQYYTDDIKALSAGAILQYIKSRDELRHTLKVEAEKLAAFYSGTVKVEINISKEGVAKLNITEYNIE